MGWHSPRPSPYLVDNAIRVGSVLPNSTVRRFKLMNRSEGGRKGFVAMLVAITESGPLGYDDWTGRRRPGCLGTGSLYESLRDANG